MIHYNKLLESFAHRSVEVCDTVLHVIELQGTKKGEEAVKDMKC